MKKSFGLHLVCSFSYIHFEHCVDNIIIQYIESERRCDVRPNAMERDTESEEEKSQRKQNWITSHNNILDYFKDYLLVQCTYVKLVTFNLTCKM